MKSNYRINEKRMEHAVKIPLKIIDKVKPSICKIICKNNKGSGTGFFIQLNDYKCIMTNYHIISTDLINQIIYIKLYNNKALQIKLKEEYIKFFRKLDITIIELDYIESINNYIKDVYFLDYDSNYNKGYKQYLDLDIFTLQYPSEDIEVASGKLIQISKEFEFKHNIDTDYGSSGSPIILFNTLKVIGIHKNGLLNEKINFGTFIGEIFKYNKFKKLNNNISININVMMNNNNMNFGMPINNNNMLNNNNMNFGMPINNNNMRNNNNMNFGMPINNNNMMNNNMNFGMGMMGIPNNNMMMNNNFNNFDMGNNMMKNNINNNFGMPGLGNIQNMNPINNCQNMMNNNEMDNNPCFDDINEPGPKKNICFRNHNGITTFMVLNYGTTIDEMLKKYLNLINRPYLYGQSNKIEFIYNAGLIRFGDKTSIGELFKYHPNPKVVVDEKQHLIGSSLNMKLIKTESIVYNKK